MLSFAKSRRRYRRHHEQIPTLTNRGNCISGTATPSAVDATPQPCAVLHEEEEEEEEKEKKSHNQQQLPHFQVCEHLHVTMIMQLCF